MDEHYFSRKPKSALHKKQINTVIGNHHFVFIIGSGVFSAKGLDKGSMLLAENAVIKGRVLDLGCGWGLIGIAVKKLYPDSNVVMSDINTRALKLAEENVKLNRVKVEIVESSLYSKIEGKFDTILVNPPMKAGRELCYSIIEQAKSKLNAKGILQLVAMHNKGGSMLEKKMKEVFGNVDTLAKKGGFRVYKAKHINEAG